jgi:hypothetical protein
MLGYRIDCQAGVFVGGGRRGWVSQDLTARPPREAVDVASARASGGSRAEFSRGGIVRNRR